MSIALIGLVLAALPQNQQPPATPHPLSWPAPHREGMPPAANLELAGPITASAVGHFYGPHRTSAAVLYGTTPLLIADPVAFTAQVALERPANDLATWSDPAHPTDALALVGSEGAFLVRQAFEQGDWVSHELAFADATWVDARSLAVGDFAGSGAPGIAAIAADGMAVRVATPVGTDQFALHSFALPVEATRILAARWTHHSGSGPERSQIVLATASGLRVYDDGGQLLHSRGQTLHDDHLVLLRGHNQANSGQVLDAVAWFTPHPDPQYAGKHALIVVGHGMLEPTRVLREPALRAVAGGPLLPGDGLDDLLLVHQQEHIFQVLANGGPQTAAQGTSSFAPAAPDRSIEYHLEAPDPQVPLGAVPAVGPFHGRGLNGVVIPVESESWLSVARPEVIANHVSGGSTNIGLFPPGTGSYYHYCPADPPAPQVSYLSLVVDLPVELPLESSGQVPTTHLEVAAFIAPCAEDGNGDLCEAATPAEGHTWIEFAGLALDPQDPVYGAQPVPAAGFVRCRLVIQLDSAFPENVYPEERVVYALVRPAHLDLQAQEIVALGRSYVGVWAPQEQTYAFYPWIDEAWWQFSSTELARMLCASFPTGVVLPLTPLTGGSRVPVRPPAPPPELPPLPPDE